MLLKKCFFLVLLLVGFISPSFAVQDILNNDPDKCDSQTLHITAGTAILAAQWEPTCLTCNPGTYLPANAVECVACPNGYECPGGEICFKETVTQGDYPCGRKLHIGKIGQALGQFDDDKYLCLYEENAESMQRKTEHVLVVKIDNKRYLANLTTTPTVMNKKYVGLQNNNKLAIKINGVTYYAYDVTMEQ